MKEEPIKITRKNIESVAVMIEHLLDTAIQFRASDIHIDPKIKDCLIQFRIDGIISTYAFLDKFLLAEVVGRIKVLAGLRGDIHDKSQDGRFYRDQGIDRVDIRVSIAPTYYGENIVMRLLSQNHQRVSELVTLGFSSSQIIDVLGALEKSQGLIIVSGPTGAGKTSTIYSMLQYICMTNRVVVSLEDPVEYPLPGVRQIQLKPVNGYGFHQALRGVLRQDPDVIMVGEIRDKETAAVVMNIALTGHLVITSLHTEDAAHVVPRLIDMGIDPYLMAATIKVLISQRLVRKIDNENGEFRGRIGVFEVMKISEDIREMMFQRASAEKILEVAQRNGYETMQEDGKKKIALGLTTESELRRVLQ